MISCIHPSTGKSMATAIAFLGLVALTSSPLQAQESYGQWSKYRTLTLNTMAANGGANVNGTVTGVPVLVRLTSAQADVFTGSLANGADIRFTKADGATRLPHETQNWNATGQTASFWVRLDSVYAADSTQKIRLYWGKAGAADSSSSVSVFRTADGYQGVWHLEGSYNDGTANANNGANTGTLDTAGAVGRGRWFNGTSNYISIPNTATMNAANPLSVEAWVKWQGIGTGATDRYRPVINHGSANGGDQFFLYARNPSSGGSASYYSFGYYTGSATNDAQYATNVPADASNWVHLTGAYNGTTWFLYRNGVQVASAARTGTPANATTPWYIGAFGGATTSRYFFGSLDEIRFSSVVRDSNWVRLSYETQKAGATALTIGTSQSGAPSNLSYLADPANYVANVMITPNTATVTGTVDSFTVTPALPTGLAFDKVTGTISGTPTVATAVANYVVTAINAAGSVTDTVSITVNAAPPAAPTLAYAPSGLTYTVGTAIAALTPTLGGGAADSITVSPALPAGLALNKTTGVVSGTPSAVTASASYVFTATNIGGQAKDTVTVSVLPAPPTNLVYPTQTASYVVGQAIANNTPTVSGTVDSFTVAPALPAGLALNKTSGVISGTPTASASATNYVVTAANAGGSAMDTLGITVLTLPPAPSNLIYPVQVASYVVGQAIATNTPTVSGAVDSFTVAPALPAGLSFNKTTGAISGTPTAASATSNYVVSAVNAGGSAKDTLGITVDATENLATWSGHRNVWLNTSPTGANVAGTVTNFPVLVRLGAPDTVFAQSKGRGADLRFTKAGDAVVLKHQIESWDSAGGTAAVWVLVDSVKGGNSNQIIRMHWGKMGAAGISDGSAVFDTTRGFEAVWHFGEGTEDTAFDATSNKLHAVPSRTSTTNYSFPADTVGVIGRARRYGTNTSGSPSATSATAGNSFYVPNSASGPLNFPEDGVYTVSAWANVPAVGTSRSILSKSDRAYYLELRATGRQWEFSEFQAGSGWDQTLSDTIAAGSSLETATNNNWQHLVGVRNGTAQKLYWNGVVVDSTTNLDPNTGTRLDTSNFNIGRNPTATGSRYWRGRLDEIRVASVARGADWIKLEFENQKPAQSLVTFIAPPVAIAAAARARAPLSLTVKALPGGMLIRLPGIAGEDFKSARVSLLDMRGRAVWNASFAPGADLVWNGVDEGGRLSPAGLYLVRVKMTDFAGETRTLVTRVPLTR